MNIDFQSIKNSRCIFIYGADAFQRDRIFKDIIKSLNITVNDGVQSYLFYGDDYAKDSKITSIIDALNMYSFDLSEKIISVKYFEKMNKKAIEKIATYTTNPNPHSKLILVNDKVDGRVSAFTTIKKNSLCFETSEMKYQRDLLNWLNNYLRENNLQMDDATKSYFTNIIELDAFTAYNEMKKLELYTLSSPMNGGKMRVITISDIKKCTFQSKQYTVFDLQEAIGLKNRPKALEIADSIIKNGESIIMIIGSLTNFFLNLWKLDALKRKGISIYEIKANHMKDTHPYYKDKQLSYSNNFQTPAIENALKHLYQCDCRAKLTMAEDNVLITCLIWEILSIKPSRLER